MAVEDIAALAESVSIWRGQEIGRVVCFTLVIWYYVTTLDSEVKYIWPQSPLKLGKILYFTARYGFAIFVVAAYLIEFPTHIPLSIDACNAVALVKTASMRVTWAAAEAIQWLCLYALVHGKRRYLVALVLLFLAYQGAFISLIVEGRLAKNVQAVPREQLDEEMGYACTWEWQVSNPEAAYATATNINKATRNLRLSMLVFTALFAIAVFATRYKRQRGRLIKVILREGALYYVAIISVHIVFVASGAGAVLDPYAISDSAANLALIFSDRLLHNLRESDDPGTRKFVSTLVFDDTDSSSSSSDDGVGMVDSEDSRVCPSSDSPSTESYAEKGLGRDMKSSVCEHEIIEESTKGKEKEGFGPV